MSVHSLLAAMIVWSSLALANEGEKKSDSHGGGHAQDTKADAHGSGHGGEHGGGEKKADAHGGGHGGGHEEAPAAPPPPQGPKREYTPGKVTKFPGFKAPLVGSGELVEFKPEKGRAAVIIFIASWCDPCQVLMGEFTQIARKYAPNNTDIFFVFAHDTKEDAAGFTKEHQLTHKAVMANAELLKAFKNPELPSVYVADRWGYMVDRFISTKKGDIEKIDIALSKITAL